MRETKFRGISYTAGDWVYGYFIKAITGYCEIVYQDELSPLHGFIKHHVIPESVGEFTGLLDRERNEIWEGDIMRYQNGDTKEVIYLNEAGSFGVLNRSKEGNSFGSYRIWDGFVIGNVHETPELIPQQPT